ncbi:MAG: putative regulatory protein [Amycolatopsis sp.]|uniref:AAA family ATPase n=1 Tax=Amycolatopsis sp. TaxID=37632 RepID=UPI00261F0110|nr:AAA family ATPase [Amycolatopsis sp.]MCU1680212.1 putative regulatory protein [Amycolatopsis sp.]
MTTPATPTTAPAAPGTTTAAPAGGRLPNGELRRRVAEVLAARAGTDMTPRTIAAELGGKSSGAIGNALAALTAGGYAEQTSAKPVRYRSTPTTADAAAAPVAVPTGTPRRRPRTTPRTTTPPATTTPTPPAPTAAPPVTGPVTRPNGQLYHPRTLSGIPDVTALRKLRDAGVAALLYGPPGTGKTSVIEAAFGDLITIQGDGDTTVADIVGEYTQTKDGNFEFVHGPLVRAMREGRTLLIDDATLIPPTVLAVVYPAMDGRRQIIVKAHGGEVVDAAPGFYVVAGHNPGVHGAVLTDALASRFSVQIQVSTDYDLAAQLKIDKRAVAVARNLATRQASGEIRWAPQLRELLAFHNLADALGADAAAGNLISTAPEEDRDIVATVVRTAFGKTVAPLALGARI